LVCKGIIYLLKTTIVMLIFAKIPLKSAHKGKKTLLKVK